MQKTKTILLIFTIALIFFSCIKKPEKRIIGSWKIEKLETSINGGPFLVSANDCFLDDIWTFKKDGSFIWDNGLTCSSGSSEDITWSIKGEDTIIYQFASNILNVFHDQIIEISKNKLVTIGSVNTYGSDPLLERSKFTLSKY